MSAYFFDTSALAKRYLKETGQLWVKSLVDPRSANIIAVSDIASVEMFSVIARYERAKHITTSSANRLRPVFLNHFQVQYAVIKLDDAVLQEARQLVTVYQLRALDSLQLACAKRARTDLRITITFVCGDQRLLTAAVAEGFTTDDPNLHP